eukprot:CAMPEP_0201532438 /NCGR_PEP_ID=MMETSP0161_2-20130828/50376_1 /ASSEMBLY_ACC=CAM_ASM_000251 /TAXON_ID=180227 /ORGANISM="Neoparamoeba aestuarina, Strain SoJaBio B1-5/56/2" /LENGTH=380 /DNA_ID=CAMNT_0047935861 /DNA_START=261 /DNA_END=1399 /DNA_ORIENTATION=-
MTKEGEIKLADFGVSEQLSGAISSDEVAGSPHWMAPEVVLGTDYDARCDLWSVGITAIEMAEGLPPKANMNPILAMKSVPKDPPPTLQDDSKHIPEFKTFLEACLVKDPAQRPNAIETLIHPFIAQACGHEVLRATVTDMLKIQKKEQQEKERKKEEEEKRKAEIEKAKNEKPKPLHRALSTDCPKPPVTPLPPPSALGTFVSSDGGLGTFVSSDSPSSSLGTFVASDSFGTFVPKEDEDDVGQFGTFVARRDEEDDGQFGTFVAKRDDDDGGQFGTFVAKNDDDGGQFGTFVAKNDSDDGAMNFGTFVAKNDSDDGGQFGTFVAKKDEEPKEAEDYFGTFVFKADDPATFATVRRKEKSSRPSLDMTPNNTPTSSPALP